ncbi:hypothetical protein SEA_ALI17_25 [Gordonia phage Ali17]|uniref:Uncharacterized protein n=1 Tax=Gordonia phage Ali17 TaxID=2301561 RepID=A0A385DMR4_9CAUD|nr:hypothetical protein J1772_gp25 [Gordonia phage Ali17]AXQ60641.1 hypothetical protein SEA_ALI17_25 [Gordonia phage Ali17]
MSRDMAEVTIKAQQSVGRLRAGDVVTVERSDYVNGLIKRGRVAVVDDAVTDESIVVDDGDKALPVRPGDLPEPPKRNASRDDWAEYLAEHVHIEGGTEGKTRPELLEAYDRFIENGTTATPAPAPEGADAATDSGADGTDGGAGDGTD